MKSTTLLATFALLCIIKFVNGQQNNVVPRENFETFNYLPQNQPTNKITKSVDMLLDQNGNIIPLPKNAKQNEILMQTNTPQPVASIQQIQLPPDIKPQPLQVQQHLKLQSPLQLQQSLPLQAQLQTQNPLQGQQPLQLQSQLPIQYTQASTHLQTPPVQSQVSLQSQQPVQSIPHLPPQAQVQPQMQTQPHVQAQLQTHPHPQVYEEQPKLPMKEHLQLQQTLQLQQPLQPQQSHQYLEAPVPLPIQQVLQTQQPLRELMAFKLPQSFYPQQFSQSSQPLPPLTHTVQQLNSAQKLSETLNLVETGAIQQKNTYQPNLQTNFKWLSSNPPVPPNIDKPKVPSLNIEDNRKSVIYPVDIIPNIQKSNIQNAYRNSENPSSTYYFASQQSPPSPVVSSLVPVVPNSYSNVVIPTPNIKSAEGANIPLVSPYMYKPVSESNPLVQEITEPINLIPQTPPILKVPSSSIQNTYYYNQQNTDTTPNSYIGQNVGYHYPQQSSYPVIVLQSHPSTIIPSQSPILSSISIPTIQAPSVSSQYGYSSSYPLNTIVAPAFRSQSSKSSNLKSFLPLIFNLLKEKIASCACQNDCQCDCKNNSIDNELEVSSGYSSQKRYGANIDDHLSVLNTVCKESEGIECPRERKNCEQIEAASSEISNETQEDKESEEEGEEAEAGEEEETDEEDSEEE